MRISLDELFGPAVGLTRCDPVDEAIASANDTNYGLSAAVFTEDLDNAMRFAKEVDSGNIHINGGTLWRADLMPRGSLKESRFGKEVAKYAVQERTATMMVGENQDGGRGTSFERHHPVIPASARRTKQPPAWLRAWSSPRRSLPLGSDLAMILVSKSLVGLRAVALMRGILRPRPVAGGSGVCLENRS